MDKLKYIKLENEDGSYSNSIPLAVDSDHVDVNGNTLTNELSHKANNSSINNLQNQINSLASGSPLVASSTSSMTDTTRIYVNTTDGHWYWYNGTAWTDGGVYQATGIDNNSVHLQHLNKDVSGNKYHYEASSTYPGITFVMPERTNTSSITSIGIKVKFKNVGANISSGKLGFKFIQPNWWDASQWFIEFDPAQAENNRVYNLDLKKNNLDMGNHNFERINVLFGSNTTKSYEFYFEDIELYINNQKVEGLTLLSDEKYEDISNEISFLATKKYVDDITTNMKTDINFAKSYDSLSKSNLKKIVCWGDSLTEGGSPGPSYVTILQSLLGNEIVVTNRGRSGQCSGGVALRQGGNVVRCNESFTIPSSGASDSFTMTFSSGYAANVNTTRAFVTILGIEGELVITKVESSTGILTGTFTRSEAGESISVPSGTQLVSVQDIHNDNVAIIWVGRNDMAFAWPYQVSGTFANVKAMVEHLSPTIKRFLVISCTTTTTEAIGDEDYGWVVSLNNKLREEYPNNFVDIEDYLVNQCIYDAGITPTADDIKKMEDGTIPPSLMYDFVHPNNIAKQYIAQYIYNEMLKRDWVR